MKVSANGRKEIKLHEGEVLTAYKDVVGVWTIGVGHTAAAGSPKPVAGMKITAAESDEILARDLATFEKAVTDAVKVPLTQNQFDALVSLAFNIGAGAFSKSTLVRRLNAKDYQGAAEQFLVWNKAGGKVVKGLVTRRVKERALFLKQGPLVETPLEAPQKPVQTVPEAPAPTVAKKEPNLLVTLLIVLWNALKGKR